MALFGGRKDSGGHSLGVVSALLFNLSMFVMPFAAINAWQATQNADVYGYAITDASKTQTKRALEDAAATLIPDTAADRRVYWSGLIQREVDEGDFAAARGLLLSARTMLPPANAASLEAQLPPNADDRTRTEAALIFLDDGVRKQFESGVSPIGASTDPLTIGDAAGLADQSSRWVNGEPIDVVDLILSGLAVGGGPQPAAPGADAAQAKTGVSLIKLAKRAGGLSTKFAAQIQTSAFAAVPPNTLKQALAKVFADPKTATSQAAIIKAFNATIDPAGYTALLGQLTDIKAISDKLKTPGALQLLRQADDATDLKRLRLIAEAGGDRAIAVAKRAGKFELLKSAKGTLKMTQRLWFDFGAFALSLFFFGLGVFSTLWQALLLEWRHGAPHDDEDEATA